MCKCLQNCFETWYWHLIEKRFCYDENIALYDDPMREETVNNYYDNMAFYDSVSVIAGRSIVTIDATPSEEKPIVQQPRRRLWWQPDLISSQDKDISKSVPILLQTDDDNIDIIDGKQIAQETTKERTVTSTLNIDTLKPDLLFSEIHTPKKSLSERRMSKSLYLKIDQPREIPIIRQQSMPKFYLDTPDDPNSLSMFAPSLALTSPVPKSSNFVYDLYSVVQMERDRVQNLSSQDLVHRKESDRSSKLLQIREKIKLRRVKSSLGTTVNQLPHCHHHI